MEIGSMHLRYATVQPFARLQNGKETTYYFVATSGVIPEFAWEKNDSVRVHTASGTSTTTQGITTVSGLEPSLIPAITVKQSDGIRTNIVLISQQTAEGAWKIGTPGLQRLLLTTAQIYSNKQNIFLNQDGNNHFSFQVTPSSGGKLEGSVHFDARAERSAEDYSAAVPAVHPTLQYKNIAAAGDVPPARMGTPVSWRKAVAVAPSDADFENAAKWSIDIPSSDWAGAHELFLDVTYIGDVARLTSGGKLLEDDFYNGKPLQIGLSRFREAIEKAGLDLQILPIRKDAPIFLEDRYRIPRGEGQIVDLKSVTIAPQYQLTIDLPQPH